MHLALLATSNNRLVLAQSPLDALASPEAPLVEVRVAVLAALDPQVPGTAFL